MVRAAMPRDTRAIAEIYAHYVATSAATFEESAPGTEVIAERMDEIASAGLPFLVFEDGARILGYAYLAPYKPRSAYRYTAEDSVYVAAEARGRGVGRALLERLLEAGEAAGVREVVAIIALTEEPTSVALHLKVGFEEVGRLRAVGFKHGRWYDTLLMQRSVGPRS